MEINRPAKIGKYDVVDVIGRGGMGIVYKGTDPHLGRMVAIKMMTGAFTENPDLLKRFYREAQSTGSLQHPNIVTVYELGDQGGNPYLVMEYLEGESLDSVISARRPLGLLEKINLIIDVCQGLSYAHHRGIVHRDIKPANIMVLKDGGVKIVDFGIAHIGDRTVTRTGQIIGSLSYMSPEQINGKIVDTRSDLFSTGVVLYQLFTYALPFEGATTAATLLKIIHEPPPPLRKYIEQVYPPDLEEIVLRALTKDRDDRYQSAEDFCFDLGQVRDQIKQEVIEQHLTQAEQLLAQQQLLKAKEQLLNVLKMDRQHSRAVQLMRSVAQRIQQEEAGEQVRQLRAQAEDALLHQQFDAALEFVEKAISLNRTDPELQRLRANIQQAKTRAHELQLILQRAESAHQRGDLDLAKQAVEEALVVAPNDIHAKALYRVIHRDWVERSRQRQVAVLLDSARKEISSRRFTVALDLLKQAEALDPNAPQLRALIDSANSGREQELRRKELESINGEIEAALDRDDFRVACAKADEGLRRFPDDRGLQKLKALADKQRQVAERQRFIDEELAKARELMEAGRAEEVLTLLRAAQQKVGADTHLDSLLGIARETVQRQRADARKADYLRHAKEALRHKEYDDAIATLRKARVELGGLAEIDDLLQFAEEEAAALKRRKIADAAAERARALIAEEEHEKAIDVLKAALRDAPEEDLRALLAEAERGASEYQKNLRAALTSGQEMLQARKAAEAVQFLESQPSSFSRSATFQSLLQKAREQGDLLRKIGSVIERSRVSLEQNDFNGALRILQESARGLGPSPEIDALTSEIEKRRSAAAGELVRRALADARMLLGATEYRTVLEKLNAVSESAGIAPPPLQAEYQALQRQAIGLQARQYKSQIEQLISAGDHLQASDLLQQASAEFPQNRELLDLDEVLDREVRRRREAQKLLAEAQKFFHRAAWKEGADLCARAASCADRDPLVRKQVLATFHQAAQTAVATDWRSAEMLLQQLGKQRPDVAPDGGLLALIVDAKREELVLTSLKDAKGLQSQGDLKRALAEIERGLLLQPEEARLLELRQTIYKIQREQEEHARVERERLQRAAYLKEIRDRIQREPAPDRRILILEEALRTYSDEVALQQDLEALRTVWNRVTSLAREATSLEESCKFVEAIQRWQAVRAIDARYPGLDSALDRLRHLQEQARSAAKANWVAKIQNALTAFDYEGAGSLLLQADREFSADPQLEECSKSLQERVKVREKALKLAADAQKLFGKQRWEKALESLRRGVELAGRDSLVRQEAFAQLMNAAEVTVSSDWQVAEQILEFAAELHPGSAEVARLGAMMESRKRQRIVGDYLHAASKAESAGDLRGALTRVEQGLVAYPDEPQLSQKKVALQATTHAAEEARLRQRNIARHMEAAHRLSSTGDLQGSLGQLEQALVEFPAEPQLSGMKNAVESAIRETEEKRRREEEKQRRAEQQGIEELARRAREEEQRLRQEQKRRGEQKQREEAQSKQRDTALEAQRSLAARTSVTPIKPQTGSPLTAPPRTATLSASFADIPGWREDILRIVEKELALFIGPLAGIIVHRAACRTSDPEELYRLLAPSLEKEGERQAFLARRTEVFRNWGKSQPARNFFESSSTSEPISAGLRPEFTPETIERAAGMLAPYVGPISRVLVKKAALRADNLHSLYLILAEHLEKKSERASFLRDSGFTDSEIA